ncbi:hypothetical protein [Comamonas sp.]|uniref:hypothetical protein n=1 Tax=Comamonas sp. TaxID=34028 RepID=UPI003A8CBB70
MTFAHNTPPPNNHQRPTPIDRRFDNPEAFIEAAVRRVLGNTAATIEATTAASSDPIRDMVMNALDAAGIATEGKSDSQMLAEYTELVRKAAQAAKTTATNSRAFDEFSGYDMNALMGQQKD